MNNTFLKEWKLQQGSQMLKSSNNGIDWKRTVALHFWGAGIRSGKKELEAKLKESNKRLFECLEWMNIFQSRDGLKPGEPDREIPYETWFRDVYNQGDKFLDQFDEGGDEDE